MRLEDRYGNKTKKEPAEKKRQEMSAMSEGRASWTDERREVTERGSEGSCVLYC